MTLQTFFETERALQQARSRRLAAGTDDFRQGPSPVRQPPITAVSASMNGNLGLPPYKSTGSDTLVARYGHYKGRVQPWDFLTTSKVPYLNSPVMRAPRQPVANPLVASRLIPAMGVPTAGIRYAPASLGTSRRVCLACECLALPDSDHCFTHKEE